MDFFCNYRYCSNKRKLKCLNLCSNTRRLFIWLNWIFGVIIFIINGTQWVVLIFAVIGIHQKGLELEVAVKSIMEFWGQQKTNTFVPSHIFMWYINRYGKKVTINFIPSNHWKYYFIPLFIESYITPLPSVFTHIFWGIRRQHIVG